MSDKKLYQCISQISCSNEYWDDPTYMLISIPSQYLARFFQLQQQYLTFQQYTDHRQYDFYALTVSFPAGTFDVVSYHDNLEYFFDLGDEPHVLPQSFSIDQYLDHHSDDIVRIDMRLLHLYTDSMYAFTYSKYSSDTIESFDLQGILEGLYTKEVRK